MPFPKSRLLDPINSLRTWTSQFVARRLGGYKQQFNVVDPALPLRPPAGRRVAVIGGGLAGMSAAVNLSERGFEVTLLERNTFLGGKIGSWPVRFPDGATFQVEHGFHAFFRNYYNLQRLLEKSGTSRHYADIEDYVILTLDKKRRSYRDVARTPVVNLFSLAMKGHYRLRDMPWGAKSMQLLDILRYDESRTFAAYDDVSFKDFAKQVSLPNDLQTAFKTFSRAFFCEEDRVSMAELIKGFHFYYLSHEHGLIYDYLDGDHGRTLNQPLRQLLERNGARVLLGQEVPRIERSGAGFAVLGEAYDAVVLASDVVGSRTIGAASSFIRDEQPALHAQLDKLRPGQPYAVLRIWTDRPFNPDLPVFIFIERAKLLDSVTTYDRAEAESAAWAAEHGGSVIELHCYAIPDTVDAADEPAIRAQLLAEFEEYFPEMRGCSIRYEHLQVRRDFTAFHMGMHRDRPSYQTGIPGLYLAGDWVKLPYPAMLMEAACMSGLLCANAIFQREGLREEPVFGVSRKGLFA